MCARNGLGLATSSTCKRSVLAHGADITLADVTTHAASIVWLSSEPDTSAASRVFNAPDGTSQKTQFLSIAQFPPALVSGLLSRTVCWEQLARTHSVFCDSERLAQ